MYHTRGKNGPNFPDIPVCQSHSRQHFTSQTALVQIPVPVMSRMSLNMQSLFDLAQHAPPLHHWTRFAAVECLVSRQQHKHYQKGEVVANNDMEESQLHEVKRNYASLDSFFQDNGFPELPSTSKAAKAWAGALNKLANEVPSKKQKKSREKKPVPN